MRRIELMTDRHSLRLPDFDYAQRGAYYVSLGTRNAQPLFGRRQGSRVALSELGILAGDLWLTIPDHFRHVRLDEFVIQPTHLHGILWIVGQPMPGQVETFGKPRSGSLSTILRSYKAACTREWRIRSGRPEVVIWQGRFLERVVRSRRELSSLRCFVRDNALWHSLSDRETW